MFDAVIALINKYPKTIEYLSASYKTYDYFLARIQGLVRGVYNNLVGGEFVDIMANLISGQYYDAYSKAWLDEGGLGVMPAYLEASYQEAAANQYSFVDKYYRDIVDARIDQTSIDPLMTRAELWAQGYNTAYENATSLITLNEGGNEEWVLGETEEHCTTCYSLNGIVARAKEWEQLNIRPKNPPNEKLECGGWRCDCERRKTDKRRSPGAYGRIEEILLEGKSVKGGPGSGFTTEAGHEGRPGMIGGSRHDGFSKEDARKYKNSNDYIKNEFKEIYHHSDKEIDKFDVGREAWFTTNKYGYSRRRTNVVNTRYVNVNKMKFALQRDIGPFMGLGREVMFKELTALGFEGIKLSVDGETHYAVFDPETIHTRGEIESFYNGAVADD